jgi:hypothetical protein
MSARLRLPFLVVAGCALLPDCTNLSTAGSTFPMDRSEADAVKDPVAPEPRAKGEPLRRPADVSAPRPGRSLPDLLVGSWLHVNREGAVGDRTKVFTRDGKVITRYSYPARPGHRAGIEKSEQEYRLDGQSLVYPKSANPYDDGSRVTHYTNTIEFLDENTLIVVSTRKWHLTPARARDEADRRNVPVRVVLAEWREESSRSVYVRHKN